MTFAFRIALIIVICVLYFGAGSSAHAADSDNNDSWLSSVLGLPTATKLKITDPEIQSLGCVIGGTVVAVAAVVLSSAVIVATGGRNAAAASKVAVPVIAAAMTAGCITGNSAALGLAWIARNSSKLAGKVINALPDGPLTGPRDSNP